jgi:hypothetical protein
MNVELIETHEAQPQPETARAWLAQLEHEESYLEQLRDALGHVYEALLHGDLVALHTALEHQESLRHAGESLGAKRSRLVEELAVQLALPVEALTLERLATACPENVAVRLQNVRACLVPLAAEVHKLNETNAALSAHSLDFVNRLLLSLTGQNSAGMRYSSAGGAYQMAGCGSILSTRG